MDGKKERSNFEAGGIAFSSNEVGGVRSARVVNFVGLIEEMPKEFRAGPSSSFLTTALPSSPTPLCTPVPLAMTQCLPSKSFSLENHLNAIYIYMI